MISSCEEAVIPASPDYERYLKCSGSDPIKCEVPRRFCRSHVELYWRPFTGYALCSTASEPVHREACAAAKRRYDKEGLQ